MNRAAKRHQKKLARKAAKNRRGHPPQRLGQAAGGAPVSHFSELVLKGAQLHQTGQVQKAETIYRQGLDINPSHADTIVVRIHGDVDVCVPARIGEMTTYVLLEQEDWFEDELKFMRSVIQQRQRVVDIGANYGLYSLSLARRLGPLGRVFAFEPASQTAETLRRSISRNGFAQIGLLQTALSDRAGSGILSGAPPELKALTNDAADGGETVSTTTLDLWSRNAQCGAIDFVKIDAEGEEANIISGGTEFFSGQDPLVMLEVKHGDRFELAATRNLMGLGYDVYRLAPGLNILAPIDGEEIRLGTGWFDPYLLNLFLCKRGRATAMEAAGMLGRTIASPEPLQGAWMLWARDQTLFSDFDRFVERSPRNPFGDVAGAETYWDALDHFATAQDAALSPAMRVGHLHAAVGAIERSASLNVSAARLCTAARIFSDYGWRRKAVEVLHRLKTLLATVQITLDEPFIPAARRFDRLVSSSPHGAEWFEVSILETFERLANFSSVFQREVNLSELDMLSRSRYASPEMERRRILLGLRMKPAQVYEPSKRLMEGGVENLNAELWARGAGGVWAAI
jgi:FkbM family methyltransferase